MPRVTQKDIARELGLSPSLVSRALAGTATTIGADPQTIARIHKKAVALRYVPNAAAQQLRGGGTPVIGLTVADIEDPFFGPAVAEVIRQCHEAGYALALTGFDRRQPGMPDVQLLLKQHLSGLSVLGSGPVDWARPFVERRTRIVRIGTGPALRGITNLSVDEDHGFGLIIEHLCKLGHARFAFVGAQGDVSERRLRIVRSGLQAQHLKLPAKLGILAEGGSLDAGLAGAEALDRACGGDWPTAIVCASDAIALGVLRGVASHGVRVPEHASVTGFDDLALARLSTPPLTTVRQPMPDMVREAVAFAGEGRPPHPTHAASLVVRGSTTTAWNA